MPIRPIQVIQSQNASLMQHVEHHRMAHAQIQNSNTFKNMVQKERVRTKEPTKSENNEFRYDAKEKGQNSYSGSMGKGKKNKDKKEKKSEAQKVGGGIDILI
ncbi:MAG: hypothetical protein GX306_00380 [Clostridiales bacterium]|jgi:hypothetical protein|nr:hypothetical protein [Clostridiales bacterium]